MMKKGANAPFRIALYGMDSRASKNMEMYLKGPCHGAAVVVGENEADIDLIDADYAKAKDILEARRTANPSRPIILMSLQQLQIDNTFFIKKPVTVTQMAEILAKIKASTASRQKIPDDEKPTTPLPKPATVKTVEQSSPKMPPKVAIDVYAKKATDVKHIDEQERQKTAKHQSAMQLNEGGFTAFLGTVSNIDFEDSAQLLTASYDPRQAYLGYVQSAYKTAKQQARVLQLNSIWKSLLIFPESQEIWLDADDKQLRAFAGITLNKGTASNMALTLANTALTVNRALDKFQDIDAFMWKLAIWTSKGRFPMGLDIQRPVFLKRWPNFTRLVITPDALRMAALLVEAPRTPLEVATVLNVKPQYVFVFISACHTLGLLGQIEPQETPVATPEQTTQAKTPKNKGLLSKILGKLRGA